MGLAEKGFEFINRITENAGYKQEWIVLREDDTSPDYGVMPYARPIEKHVVNGVINLDKPPGPTSHEVVAWIKKLFNVEKAGHGGTLDPKVTGVLPVALANATKVIGNVIHTMKEYVMVIQLHGDVSEEKIREALNSFVGVIYQKPPLRSSVKRMIRKRRIFYIDLLEIRDRYVLVRVGCQAGTYMRKLAHDLGLLLGIGAHMRELRRTRTGPFKEDETLVKMQEVSEALYMWRELGDERYLRRVVLPVETAIAHLPKIMIRDSAVVAILTLKGELVALGKALKNAEEIKGMEKGIIVKTWRVYMERGVYPDVWRRKK